MALLISERFTQVHQVLPTNSVEDDNGKLIFFGSCKGILQCAVLKTSKYVRKSKLCSKLTTVQMYDMKFRESHLKRCQKSASAVLNYLALEIIIPGY